MISCEIAAVLVNPVMRCSRVARIVDLVWQVVDAREAARRTSHVAGAAEDLSAVCAVGVDQDESVGAFRLALNVLSVRVRLRQLIDAVAGQRAYHLRSFGEHVLGDIA